MFAARKGVIKLAIWIGLGVVAVLLLMHSSYGVLFGKAQSWPHHLQMTVPSAFEAIPGERVVIAGQTAGEITHANVTESGQAHLVLGISNAAWPIPTNSQLALRLGGTIKFTDRYIQITKGAATTSWAEDAFVPPRQFAVPVEFDSLFNIFNKKTRTGMQSVFANGGPTFKAAAQPLRKALPGAPPVLSQVNAVINDLDYDQTSLSTLVSAGSELTKAVATSNPGLQTVISAAANTFGATANSSKQITQLLEVGKRTNVDIAAVLDRGARTLAPVATLSRRLEPGLSSLNQVIDPLNATLSELVSVEPSAVNTLHVVKNDGPTIDTFLTSARTSLLPQAATVAKQATTELGCVRPYTPDIVSFFEGFPSNNDELPTVNMKILHIGLDFQPDTDAETINTQQLTKMFPALHDLNPDPPGLSWNQPWDQPQCGSSAATSTASGDSENNTFDTNGTKLAPYPSSTPLYTPGMVTRTTPVRTTATQ